MKFKVDIETIVPHDADEDYRAYTINNVVLESAPQHYGKNTVVMTAGYGTKVLVSASDLIAAL